MSENDAKKKFGTPDNATMQAGMKILVYKDKNLLLGYDPNYNRLVRVQFADAKHELLKGN